MTEVLDEGPFFHGTIADLRVGDFLTTGYRSNYRPEVVMNHIYSLRLWTGPALPLRSRRNSAEVAQSRVFMSWSLPGHSRTTQT